MYAIRSYYEASCIICHAVKRHVRVRVIVDGGRNLPVNYALDGKNGLNGAGCAHGVADHGFIGGHRRDTLAKYGTKRIILHLVSHLGGGGMGIDTGDRLRVNPGMGKAQSYNFV